MTTQVIYNGVTMHNVQTREWDEELMYDASGTDPIHSKYRLMFEGTLHFQPSTSEYTSSPAYVSVSGASTVAEAIEELTKRLHAPRATLVVNDITSSGSQTREKLRVRQQDDVDNGPKPRHVRVTRVVSTECITIQFEIECTKVYCQTGTVPTNRSYVINNRWSIEEEIGVTQFTTRRTRGRIRFSSQDTPGHAFKHLVVPDLEVGFRRESLTYNVLENGLEADYMVTDRQIKDAAPFPATKMEIQDARTSNDGMTWFTTLRVALWGGPSADKRDLLTLAIRIADNKMRLTSKLKDGRPTYYVENAVILDHIGDENKVEFHLTIREPPEKTLGEFFTALGTGELGGPLPAKNMGIYDPVISEPPLTYGETPYFGSRKPLFLFLQHCYLQTPCFDLHAVGERKSAPGVSNSQADNQTAVTGRKVKSLPTYTPTQYSQDHRDNAYIMCKMETTYRSRPTRAHCPIARRKAAHRPGGPTAKTLTLALPLAYREIKLDMTRLNERPHIIKPEDDYSDGYSKEGITGTLLDHTVTPLPPTPTADGRGRLYRVIAYYLYGLDRPVGIEEQAAVGVLPFTEFGQDKGQNTKFDGKETYKVDVRT